MVWFSYSYQIPHEEKELRLPLINQYFIEICLILGIMLYKTAEKDIVDEICIDFPGILVI